MLHDCVCTILLDLVRFLRPWSPLSMSMLMLYINWQKNMLHFFGDLFYPWYFNKKIKILNNNLNIFFCFSAFSQHFGPCLSVQDLQNRQGLLGTMACLLGVAITAPGLLGGLKTIFMEKMLETQKNAQNSPNNCWYATVSFPVAWVHKQIMSLLTSKTSLATWRQILEHLGTLPIWPSGDGFCRHRFPLSYRRCALAFLALGGTGCRDVKTYQPELVTRFGKIQINLGDVLIMCLIYFVVFIYIYISSWAFRIFFIFWCLSRFPLVLISSLFGSQLWLTPALFPALVLTSVSFLFKLPISASFD